MATASAVLTDDSQLSRWDQKLYKIERVLGLISGLAVFSLMLLAVVSVSGRNLLNQPVRGYVDIIEQLMPLIAFMGISYAQRDGGHIRMDILVGRLKGRILWLIEFITVVGMLILMILIVWGSWGHFVRSFDMAMPMWSADSSMDINIPLWPAKLLAPLAFALLCVRLALQAVIYAKAFATNQDMPAGVPMIEDAATQAAKEAQNLSRASDAMAKE